MSKTSSFGTSLVLASSAQGEESQVDFGPYSFPNSPGDLSISLVSPGENNYSANTANNYELAVYLCWMPQLTASGSIFLLQGPKTDAGLQVSATNPTFLPIVNISTGGDAPTIVSGSINVNLVGSTTVIVNIGWL